MQAFYFVVALRLKHFANFSLFLASQKVMPSVSIGKTQMRSRHAAQPIPFSQNVKSVFFRDKKCGGRELSGAL